MGFPEGLKICHTKRFFLEFTLGLFQKSLFDMRNIYKCFNKIYFWHIFYATMGITYLDGIVKTTLEPAGSSATPRKKAKNIRQSAECQLSLSTFLGAILLPPVNSKRRYVEKFHLHLPWSEDGPAQAGDTLAHLVCHESSPWGEH